jgi:hypothetical protein
MRVETLRKWMLEEGLWRRERRRRAHGWRREQKAQFGRMCERLGMGIVAASSP